MTTAVIIDDELHCREALIALIDKQASLSLVGHAENVNSGVQLIKDKQPQILFLDVEMPDGTGFQLLEHFKNPTFQVIFTTGHNAFAIKAFKHSAIDYLLKPIQKEELFDAIDRAILQINQSNNHEKIELMLESLENSKFNKLAIPGVSGIDFVDKKEIFCCEADGSYTTFHLMNGTKLTCTYNLKKVDDLLNGNSFFRIHKSYIIALNSIDKILHADGGFVLLKNQMEIPIARRRKDEFLKLLGL